MRISDWSSDVCSSDLYPLLATAKSTSETVFQIGLRMHRRGESECSEQEHDSFHGRSLASETPASYPKQASHISDQSRFPLALPHRTMLMAPPWPTTLPCSPFPMSASWRTRRAFSTSPRCPPGRARDRK